ncbi:MAG: TPM domain-containing protein [Actinomycetota bacterium]|nr:TPM domain-containing protein [Actinomycetota bacterium]
MTTMLRSGLLFALALFVVVAAASPAGAQRETVECGEYQGVVCQGYFTDETGVIDDPQRIEDAISRVVGHYGNPIAIVVVQNSRGADPADFAADLANAWGVGGLVDENGILVLVSLDERRTEVVNQTGVSIPSDAIAGSARSFFSAGDFEGGLLAIVGSIEQALAGTLVEESAADRFPIGAIFFFGIVGIFIYSFVRIVFGAKRERRKEEHNEREELIDADLADLEPSGADLPRYADYSVPVPVVTDVSTSTGVTELWRVASGHPTDPDVMRSLWSLGLLEVVDRARLVAETREPLDLRASEERALLENAVQESADDALGAGLDDVEFESRRRNLNRLIASLRPHRVAAARRRTGDALVAELIPSPIGDVSVTPLGLAVADASPAFDGDAPLSESVAEYRAASVEAEVKIDRLERLYEHLPESTARPAVAAALADLDDNTDRAIERYESVRASLAAEAAGLTADGLDPAAIAALLLMNRNERNTREFLDGYRRHRDRGFDPAEAVEFALAGLMTDGAVDRVRAVTRRLDLPISITAALLDRRDDGPEVYEYLRDELAAYTSSDSARTIAGVLAMSLEPTQAMRRWLSAREALHQFGLIGSYADVAAAFGASDPRGPREFAVAYAAQRRALSDSSIDDADRFAPELAHAGTGGQTDTWNGTPIPGGIASFDPFTFFFAHWVITRGVSGSYGWEPVYADASWSKDRGSWWGGGGGFGSSGGSSWGGSSWSGGSFGGFSGGGGFSSSGGGSW